MYDEIDVGALTGDGLVGRCDNLQRENGAMRREVVVEYIVAKKESFTRFIERFVVFSARAVVCLVYMAEEWV